VNTHQFKPIQELLETESGIPFIHRDLSWLSFNYRVLQEAMDQSVPLVERIRFLGIYSNNMDEFYIVLTVGLFLLACIGFFGYAIVKMVGNDDEQD
jgi:hypothetical protein